MSIKKIIFCILVFIVVVRSLCFSVSALDTGFSTEEIESQERKTFLENVDLITTAEATNIDSIMCFDISDNGMIAIGSAGGTTKHILILDTYGRNGDFGVQWNKVD